MKLYLVRHGQTVYNVQGRAQGWCDSDLTEKGVQQAKDTGELLKHISFVGAYSGDLNRQIQTAQYILEINKSSPLKLELLPELRESHYGSFEGIPDVEMLTPVFDHYQVPYGDFRTLINMIGHDGITDYVASLDPTHRAENSKQVTDRGLQALQNIVNRHQPEENVLVVSSGDILGMVLEAISSVGKKTGQPQIVVNGSVNILDYQDGQFSLVNNYERNR